MHGAALRGTARPLWLPNDPRDLTTRVAREERELGRLARVLLPTRVRLHELLLGACRSTCKHGM